jgi:hypothetical protein
MTASGGSPQCYIDPLGRTVATCHHHGWMGRSAARSARERCRRDKQDSRGRGLLSRGPAPCEVPSAVMRIARAAQIPTGIERLPDDCPAVRSRALNQGGGCRRNRLTSADATARLRRPPLGLPFTRFVELRDVGSDASKSRRARWMKSSRRRPDRVRMPMPASRATYSAAIGLTGPRSSLSALEEDRCCRDRRR